MENLYATKWGTGVIGLNYLKTKSAHRTVSLVIGLIICLGFTLLGSIVADIKAAGGTPPKPNLTLAKTDTPDLATASSLLTYTLIVANTGDANATGVVMTDTLDSNVSFVSASTGGSHNAGVVSWTLGIITPGQTVTQTLVVLVNSNVAAGTILANLAVVTSIEGAIDRDAATTPVLPPDLKLTKTDVPDPVAAGKLLSYTLVMTNVGGTNATSVIISDTLDPQVSFASASDGGSHSAGVVTWVVPGLIIPGQTITRTLAVTVGASVISGTLVANTAKVTSNEGAIDIDAVTTTVIEPRPELIQSKTDTPDPVTANNVLTYTIAVTNIGVAEATGVVITDTLNPQVSFRSASDGGQHDGQPSDGVVTWTVSALGPGQTITRTVSVTVGNNLPLPCLITNTTGVTATEGVTASATATTTVQSVITINACQDQDADGICGPGGPLPAGVQACLIGSSFSEQCQNVPAPFTGLSTGTFTASLKFTGASQGYYPTIPYTTTTLAQCSSISITLPIVNPVHPKGVAIHPGLNKVYVAFQGPVVFSPTATYPYPFVAVIDGVSDRVLGTIPGGSNGIGRQPWGVAVSGGYVYVGSFGEGRVSVINPISDTISANLQPGTGFALTTAAVNPTNGHVHFPDYQGGRVVIITGTTIVATPTVIFPATTPSTEAAISPFEMVVANSLQGYNFVTLRDAFRPQPPLPFPPYKFVGFNSNSPFALKPQPIALSNPAGASGAPHAIGLWQAAGQNRLFITYADDPRPTNEPFPNPNKLLVYSFSISNPDVITKENEITLTRNYAEVGLIYNSDANHMLGTYAGFAYKVGITNTNDITACNPSARGGTYALNFNGDVLSTSEGADTASVWKLPKIVVGNPPLTATGLQYRNPFEIALNPNNGKVYVTDRCWNEFPGGGPPRGSGAVLIFSDTPTVATIPTPNSAWLPVILKDSSPPNDE